MSEFNSLGLCLSCGKSRAEHTRDSVDEVWDCPSLVNAKVRVDFFKPTGKWYTTEELEIGGVVRPGESSLESFLVLRLTTEVEGQLLVRYQGMTAVCLDWGGVPALTRVPHFQREVADQRRAFDKTDVD